MDTLRDWQHAKGSTSIVADVVVIGSGPGGASVARVLSARGARVCVLEEGPARPRFRPNQRNVMRYHMQEGGAMIARGSTIFPIAAGRGVGGGSLVNSAISLRAPDRVLAGWKDVLGGDDRFEPAKMKPVYDEISELVQVAVTPDAIAGENNRLIVRGARTLGLPGGLLPRNTPHCVGCGMCNFGCPVGGKASVDKNMIPEAMERGTLVQADTKVDRILVEGGRAVGATGTVRHPETREEVGRIEVRAPIVFVCCGGIGTPRLLHHAGLGPRLGPAVGEGLHVHPGSTIVGICDYDVHMWQGATQAAYFEHPDMPGFLPHTFTPPPGVLYLLLGKAGLENKTVHQLIPKLCGCEVMISDKGHGSVRATSDGRADIRYFYDRADIEQIKLGLYHTARVILAGGAKQVFAPIHGVGIHDTAESLAEAIADKEIWDFQMYASHPMSTCRMGVDPKTSVIGPDGQAHGLPGLYLADSSVFPTSLGVNPQLTTMTVAHVIARSLEV